jgi:hypothetical protein
MSLSAMKVLPKDEHRKSLNKQNSQAQKETT